MDPNEARQVADQDAEQAEATEDVEGHNFGPAVLGTIAAMQHGRARLPEKRSPEEPLAPLTKPFPRMRDDRK